jgi:hypothetical protein
MRWLIGIAGLLALIGAVILGVGFFAVPARLEIVRSLEAPRSPAAMFALVDSQRSFADIAPWPEFDPNAGFDVTGPWRGPGQKVTWNSQHPGVGVGGLELVSATADQSAQLRVVIGGLPPADLDLSFAPIAGGTRVTWTWRQPCPSDFAGLACRFRLAAAKRDMTTAAEIGLQRWLRRANELPMVDFAGLKVSEEVTKAGGDFAFNESETSLDPMQMQAGERAALEIVRGFLSKNGMTAVGAPIVVVTQWDEDANRYGFRAGYRFEGPAPTTALQVRLGQAPGGDVVKTRFTGAWAELTLASRQLDAFVAAYGLRPSGAPWMVYRAGGPLDPTAPVDVELYMPIHPVADAQVLP